MERLFGAIPAVLRDLGAPDAVIRSLVLASWNQAAGDLLGERTKAVEFANERLVVAVEDATWKHHLEDLAPQLLARLNSVAGQGMVKFIEFRVDPSARNQEL